MDFLIVSIVILAISIPLFRWGIRQVSPNSGRARKLIKGGYEIHPNAMRDDEKKEPKSIV